MAKPDSYTPEGVAVYETAKVSEVNPWSAEEALKSTVPLLDSQEKMDYLGYRACGFSVRESCQMLGRDNVSQKTVKRWRKEDPVFFNWESQRLEELQKTVGDTVTRMQFRRNLHMLMKIDAEAFREVFLKGLEEADDKSVDWAKNASKRYTGRDAAMFEKAAEVDTGKGGDTYLDFRVNGDLVIEETEKRAMAIGVLEDFTKVRALVPEELVEVNDISDDRQ